MAEAPLKISVSVEIQGKNQCEPLPSDFGQSERTAISFDVCFGKGTDLEVALGAALGRLVASINVARRLQIIAELAKYFDPGTETEEKFIAAAEQVCDQYDQWDKAITDTLQSTQ